VIPSADIDLTVAQITAEAEWIVIDVSECQPHDLMGCVDGRFDSETLTFSFIERVGFLKEALMDGKSILLKGHFSRELVDHLAPLLIKIDKNPAFLGRLIIVPEDALPFSFVHTTSMDDTSNKWLFLGKISEDIREKIAPYIEIGREPLSILQARVSYLTINPDGDSNLAWQGMEALDHSVHIPDALLDVHQSAEQARLFTEVRINRVKRQLKQGPVFLSGLSGVGKTTFIQKELCSVGSGYELFEGEANIKNWIESGSSDTIQLLFLDEANLSQRQWSEFEGLFQTPPALFINGIHYPVSKNHQVVFAGNPISYGDERKLAPFFLRHGGAVLFEPLSKAVMYEKILKPILNDQGIDETSIEMVSNIILDAYVLIAECSTKELLISPRELEMMALLTLCKYKKNKGVSLDESAKAAVYELGLSLIPKQHVSAQESFIAKFKPEEMSIALASTELADQDFLITPSRQCIVQQIQERLELHLWRKSTIHQLNETQLYGGLGGILITGEPGEGKSVLVVAALVRAGLQEKKPTHLTTATSDNGIFYRMPVSMGLSEKKALLIQAWNEGAIVIIDEINTSPMMEQYLNALLMGRHPETGQRPQNPGFMVIGTQNSMSSAGRRAASTALLRRVTSVTVTPYQPDEMKDILIQKGIESTEADDMVEAYIKQREHAIINHLSPLPCFRDLLRIHPIKSTYKTTKMGSNQGPSPQGDFSRILEQEVEEKRPVKTDEFTAISVIPNDDIDTTDMTLESEPIGRGNKTQTHQGQTDRVGLFKAKPPEKKIEGPQEPERDTHFSKK
jgi:predicted AAA+ superfamily ATPase